MSELQPLIQLLSGKAGWLPTVITWMGAVRIVAKPFSGKIQERLTGKMASVAASGDEEDGRDFDGLLRARWYRWTAFGLDLVCSLKLPTHGDFLRIKQTQIQTTTKS